jgi:hypothetical protein
MTRASRRLPRAGAVALLALPAVAAAQKDVSLETLARAMEGRLAVYAKNLASGEEIALNADKTFRPDALTPDVPAMAAPEEGAASRPAGTHSARTLAALVARVHREAPRDLDHPTRRALVTRRSLATEGGRLSPVVEVGGVSTEAGRNPAAAGYAATAAGDVVFAVLAANLESGFTGATVFPEVVAACVRRLAPESAERPPQTKVPGLILASLHEGGPDAALFPRDPDAAVADARRGAQRLKFNPGDVARVAVLARPGRASRVAVQWWSPVAGADATETRVVDALRLCDALFDHVVNQTGAWRVRVAFGDAIVLDEKFFVTPK